AYCSPLALHSFPTRRSSDLLPVLGGMLAVGIPEYRLPKKQLAKDIETITSLGVEVKTGVRVGKDISWEDLRSKHDAVFVAIGSRSEEHTSELQSRENLVCRL